jgi:hypothetical protein
MKQTIFDGGRKLNKKNMKGRRKIKLTSSLCEAIISSR